MTEEEITILLDPLTIKQKGHILGYPACCTEAFQTRIADSQAGKPIPSLEGEHFAGTGFVPCSDCKETINKIGFWRFVLDVITPMRSKILPPFPYA